MTTCSDSTAHVLWTGGWDSTFRVLQVLLLEKRPVQPYYIIDSERLSTGMELRAMAKIKSELFAKHPQTHELLRPTLFTDMCDLLSDPQIHRSFVNIRARMPLGGQYEWLAGVAQQKGAKLELCVEFGTASRVRKVLEPFIKRTGRLIELDSECVDADVYTVFHNFQYPTIDTTKEDMLRIAQQCSFGNLLELTWFCHNPRTNSKPCGICTPCICIIEEGMGHRLPWSSWLRYYCSPTLQLKRLLMEYPKLHSLLRTLKSKLARDRVCMPVVG